MGDYLKVEACKIHGIATYGKQLSREFVMAIDGK
jgi:hypothetical protein